ncbi:arsenical pump-driving ATPase, putative [Perkinsus marinus ATCC 50983]|uniref:Arsenical pump-driving ATPase, putative n=1 Tax=Perkinsus marinus (strain ATCC 50983 / TXsc) TaxID=423536 RepID=C5L071_PERM5|nr:arsenical pump-driving ATPase, putative [Perkinsus marinus ATCC 50983]EER09929.1 arsenical pump-driving ATPase, putative [Perkinsus marinus ATCC 50983]|eukprot:XP_002778134.1 arsenical pump-driving ATPase, putative [Perkinsus marinus ATCC 50983]
MDSVNSDHDRQAYIDKIIEDPNLKFVFVGGKGGVGKTTTSSAIAIQLAYTRKVLLLSTDPAHSLGDAFRTRFGGEPTPVPGVPNLDVLEINPQTYLKDELQQWGELAHQAGYNDLINNIEKLQDWISGIPGIDEATALSSVVDLLEGGHYDIIVFDTAPTGHTLKLLQLPDILQAGLTKLESWQTSLWQYWQMVKGGNYSQTEALRKKVTGRIRDYKKGIEKVGRMLKDRMRTTFVVVCIAEYLSIKESQRLLRELHKDQVAVSHVVVNQLVLGDFTSLSIDDAATTQKGEGVLGHAQWETVQQAVQFCRARNSIQQKYLNELRNFPEVADAHVSIVQLPLLPYEVTGVSNLLNFSQMLLPEGYRKSCAPPTPLVHRVGVREELFADTCSFMDGDRVVVTGLAKAQHYNNKPAEVVKVTDDGRVAVRVEVEANKFKMLSLKQENLKLADDCEDESRSQSSRFF